MDSGEWRDILSFMESYGRTERHSVLHGKLWWSHLSHTTLQFLFLPCHFPLATVEAALVPVQTWPWRRFGIYRAQWILREVCCWAREVPGPRLTKASLGKDLITSQMKQSCLSPLMHINTV